MTKQKPIALAVVASVSFLVACGQPANLLGNGNIVPANYAAMLEAERDARQAEFAEEAIGNGWLANRPAAAQTPMAPSAAHTNASFAASLFNSARP